MVRFQALKAIYAEDDIAQEQIFKLLCEGKSLQEISRILNYPKHKFVDWFLAEHADVVTRAERSIVHERMHRLNELSLNLNSENVAAFMAEAKYIAGLAKSWDRPKYGEHVKVERTVAVVADAGLIGLAGDLLARLSAPKERVVATIARDVSDESPI